MGEGEGARSEAEGNDLSGWAQENRGGAESTVGEGEERGVNGTRPSRGGKCRRLGPIFDLFCPCTTNSPLFNPDSISPVQLQREPTWQVFPSGWSGEVAMS